MTGQRQVGIQTIKLEGSFHEIAARSVYGDTVDYVPFETHDMLMSALFGGQLHDAVIAVDNNTSGRVVSAIDALKSHPNIQVKESVTIPIDQHLLLFPGDTLADIDAVISQQPALDQCEQHIEAAGLKVIPTSDTVEAARYVREIAGMRDDRLRIAAIASALAGTSHGLLVGPKFQDNPRNATKFWVVTDRLADTVNMDNTHTSMTFEVADRAGELHRAVGVISVKYGLNLTDIDSHLAPHAVGGRAFFAELEHGDIDRVSAAIQDMGDAGFMPRVLGHYTPVSTLEVEDGNLHVPAALKHDEWNGRHGLVYPEDATTLYVETNHKAGQLYQMLGCLSSCNLIDLGRPIVPKDHEFNRGFYVVVDPDTPSRLRDKAIEDLRADKFKVETITREGEAA